LLRNALWLKTLDKRVKIESPELRPGIVSKPTSSPAPGAYPNHQSESNALAGY